MKKALAGPAKRSAEKPERRAMIAAPQRLFRNALSLAKRWTQSVDRKANRLIVRAEPAVSRQARRGRSIGGRCGRWLLRRGKPLWAAAVHAARWAGRRLRPVLRLLFRSLATAERCLSRSVRLAIRAATRASAMLTPERAICGVIVASAACLVASQLVDYSAVEVGQPGYAGLPAATPPTVGARTAVDSHSYLLIAVALLAAALAAVAVRSGRWRLGRVVFALGLLSLAVILLVDLPAGLDAGVEASRFSGATAVLEHGFYAELASAAGLMLAGILLIAAPKAADRYHARPCRTRTSSSGRGGSAPRRRRRRRASSPGRVARSASRLRSGVVSARASQR